MLGSWSIGFNLKWLITLEGWRLKMIYRLNFVGCFSSESIGSNEVCRSWSMSQSWFSMAFGWFKSCIIPSYSFTILLQSSWLGSLRNYNFWFMYWLTRWGSSFNPPCGFHDSPLAEKWWHISYFSKEIYLEPYMLISY